MINIKKTDHCLISLFYSNLFKRSKSKFLFSKDTNFTQIRSIKQKFKLNFYKQKRMSKYKIYIGKLSKNAKSSDLEDEFSKYGKVARVDLKSGYGFVVSFQLKFV